MGRLANKRALVVVLLLGVPLLSYFYANFMASGTAGAVQVRDLEPVSRGSSKQLVVFIHGFGGTPLDGPIAALASATGDTFADADLLCPRYGSDAFCNSDPSHIANAIERAITTAYERKHYEQIVLVGYSMGALIARKAFVWGHGKTSDRPGCLQPTAPSSWVDHVDRIVLLGGANRGWSLSPQPRNMDSITYAGFCVGKAFGELTGTGGLIRSVERGSPFVADLRLQWIRLIRELGPEAPLVVELLGDLDDIVNYEDNRDIAATRDFIVLPVGQTGHHDIIDFGDSGPALDRREEFLHAVLDTRPQLEDRARLLTDSRTRAPEADSARPALAAGILEEQLEPGKTHVVFIMHGIRDNGDWTLRLKDLVEEGHPEVVAITSQYGYFSMARFLTWGDRQAIVRWFMDQYTEALARYPDAKRFTFIGHSHGTYLAAAALERYPEITFDAVILAGSVLPRAFPWNDYRDRAKHVMNFVGSADWVVGFFPYLFELFGMGDIGGAGFRGFAMAKDTDDEVRSVAGGHGIMVSNGMLPVLAMMALDPHAHANLPEVESVPWILWLSNVCWLVWLALLAMLTVPPILFVRRAHPESRAKRRLIALCYIALLLVLLHTV